MKKILTFLTVLTALMSNAQTVKQDTAFGGEKVYTSKARAIIPDSTTVRVRNIWGFNTSFNPFTAMAWDTIVNASAATDTVSLTKTVKVATTGTLFTRWEIEIVGDTTINTSIPWQVKVKDSIVTPKVRLSSKTPNSSGGIQNVDYNTGHDNATLKVVLSNGDTLCANSPTLQNQTLALTDSGTTTWTFTGYPTNYTFSYYFILQNSKFTAKSDTGWILTLPSNNAWINQVDSFSVTDSSITASTKVGLNGTKTLRTYIAFKNGNARDSVDQQVTGNGTTAVSTYATFTNLTPATGYDVWSKFVGTSTVGTKKTIYTANQTYLLKITTDSVKRSSGFDKVKVFGTLWVPSGQTVDVAAYSAECGDVTYASATATTPVSYTQGKYSVSAEFSGVQSGVCNIYKMVVYGNGYEEGSSISFTLIIPADTVKPIIVKFDTTTNITKTSIQVVYSSQDTDIANWALSIDGIQVATPTGNQGSFTFTGLQANTLHVVSAQIKDNAGNYSALKSLTVRTRDIANSNPQATLTSVPSNVCYKELTATSGGYELIDIYGTNFVRGAYYTGVYASGGADDVDTIHFVSTTHAQVWIWKSMYDAVTFSVTNPGSNPSNSLIAQVVDCITGIATVDGSQRMDRKLLKAYPNPFTDVLTIQAGQTAEYRVQSITGQIVQSGSLSVGDNSLNLQDLVSGMYILHTSTGLNTKIVKQ